MSMLDPHGALELKGLALLPASPFDAPWVLGSWCDRISTAPTPDFLMERTGGACGPLCWLYHGWSNGKGHSKVKVDKRATYLHRYSFEQFQEVTLYGGMVLDHLCRVRNCFNPLHLESVTPLENYMRGDGPKFQFKPIIDFASEEDIAALARGF